jgi:hypothetical protein
MEATGFRLIRARVRVKGLSEIRRAGGGVGGICAVRTSDRPLTLTRVPRAHREPEAALSKNTAARLASESPRSLRRPRRPFNPPPEVAAEIPRPEDPLKARLVPVSVLMRPPGRGGLQWAGYAA